MVSRDRLGRFKINSHWKNEEQEFEQWFEMAKKIMENCVIVRAEYLHISDEIEYYAISPLFDILPHGERVPIYSVQCEFIQGSGKDGKPELAKVDFFKKEPDKRPMSIEGNAIERANIKPGDTVVIKSDLDRTPGEVDAYTSSLMKILPEDCNVIFLNSGDELEVIPKGN